MANSIFTDKASMLFESLFQGLRENILHPIGIFQIGAIGATYLIAWLFAAKIQQYLEKDVEKNKTNKWFVLSPAKIAILLKYFFWLLLVWFCQVVSEEFELPVDLFHVTLNLIGVVLVITLASSYIKSTFWSRFVYVISLVVVSLRLVKLWEPTVHLLEKMAIKLGKINISIWGLIEAIIVFILLWIAAGVVNRFFTQWLTTSTKLTYSDRTLILRIVKATSAAVVILITLRAAGIHLAAFLVTGGAIGVAIGFGLREIGSNMACGIVLLLRKPIEKGDVIALEESIEGADYGWITQIGIMYVHVSTRNGTKKLIPNETFVTNKVEILSSEDNVLRLHIPFGISYESDLKKATGLALDAAMSVDRILKNPEPKCRITDFGENEVKLQLRVWINDPQNGISNVKGAILSTIWEAFHANGIVFPFPQRDLHIKDAVPLKIYEDHPRPVAKVSLEVPGKDGDAD